MKTRRIYVAGASSERQTRAKPVITALQKVGHIITFDWTISVDQCCGVDGNTPLIDVSENVLRAAASNDYKGVVEADTVVLLAPQNFSTGAWVELGIAIGLARSIFIGGDVSKCIFALLPNCIRYESDSHVVEALGGIL